MLTRKIVLSSCSLLALAALSAGSGGGCTATGGTDESAEESGESNAGVNDGFRHAIAEQVWFKAGHGYRRRVDWSSDPQYAQRGGFVWAKATGFELLPEAWWSSGLPSRTVKGFEAFTVGNNLYEQIWVVNPGNGGHTEMYERTRDVHTDAAGSWSRVMVDGDIPCTTADCKVTAWSVTLSDNKMIQAVWRGRTAHLRTNSVTLNKGTGKYTVNAYGAWGVIDAAKLPYPAGQENLTNVVGQQGFQLQVDSPIGGDCLGQPIYGQYVQAWSHEDGRGYARFVPVASDGNVLWKCASDTTLVQYAAADMPIGDSSLHLLYEDRSSLPEYAPGAHRFELRATEYAITDSVSPALGHHIGLKVVHLVEGKEVWGKYIYNHGLTVSSAAYTVIASKDFYAGDPVSNDDDARRIGYMHRCMDYIPNGYCDRNCGNDGYTLPSSLIGPFVALDSRQDWFTPKRAYPSQADRGATLDFQADVPLYGHNSNNDAEAAYQHFVQCEWGDGSAGGEPKYMAIADSVCASQCDGFAASPGSTTKSDIARRTMATCSARGDCARLGATADDDTGTRTHDSANVRFPCAGNHREGQFGAACYRVDGM